MKVVRLRNDEAAFVAIVGKPGRKFTHYVTAGLGFPLRLRRMPNADAARYSTDMSYPIKKAARTMAHIGRCQGITNGAKNFLRGGRS